MILFQKDNLIFKKETQFKGEFLSPLILNLNDKFINCYDDYNEVYHCNQLIHKLSIDSNITLDYHVLYQNNSCCGIALISFGYLTSPLSELDVNPDDCIVLNYFHITKSARGTGTFWLNDIILPHYQKLGFKTCYLKSSHQKAFSLYSRLGKKIGEYTTMSDNHQYIRNAAIFEIKIEK